MSLPLNILSMVFHDHVYEVVDRSYSPWLVHDVLASTKDESRYHFHL